MIVQLLRGDRVLLRLWPVRSSQETRDERRRVYIQLLSEGGQHVRSVPAGRMRHKSKQRASRIRCVSGCLILDLACANPIHGH